MQRWNAEERVPATFSRANSKIHPPRIKYSRGGCIRGIQHDGHGTAREWFYGLSRGTICKLGCRVQPRHTETKYGHFKSI